MQHQNYKKIELLLQYILLIASKQDDFTDQSLGEIHLIKYVYLADLEYAKYNKGNTYTELEWKFHNFGPWSSTLYNHIDLSLNKIEAVKKSIDGKDKNFIRWNIKNTDNSLTDKLGNRLNLIVNGSIQTKVKEHGSCTESLLNDVYTTLPMLQAAPGEILNFKPVFDEYKDKDDKIENIQKMTDRQKKKRKMLIEDIKKNFQKRLKDKKTKKRALPPEPPIYDDFFFKGVEYLDSLGGNPIKNTEGIITFSDDIWHSKARFDIDEL
ncbi:MAG: hypothetical protein JRJ44_06645 [Deltaproteobacteria bacterium]|nr:hypothetical protein [Deltaproteobacteria bacterium]